MYAGARVGLVVPTLDEEDAIGPALARVPRDIVDAIVVADGDSADRTAERARLAGAEVIAAGRGYGRACWRGALALRGRCDILVFMDGDGADRPEAIEDLLGPLAAGTHDLVLGSRTLGRRDPGSMGWHQIAAGRLAGGAIGILYGVFLTDMGALRALRTEALFGLGMREMTYGWNLEMLMRAARAGWRVLEVPVRYGNRAGGRSKVAGSPRGTLMAGGRLARTFLRVVLEPRPTPQAAKDR